MAPVDQRTSKSVNRLKKPSLLASVWFPMLFSDCVWIFFCQNTETYGNKITPYHLVRQSMAEIRSKLTALLTATKQNELLNWLSYLLTEHSRNSAFVPKKAICGRSQAKIF